MPIPSPGRNPYPGNPFENSVWMMANPDWAAIMLNLEEVCNRTGMTKPPCSSPGGAHGSYTSFLSSLQSSSSPFPQDPDLALSVAQKALDNWRYVLNDQWNVAGLVGGYHTPEEGGSGLPYMTSHYGFYMTAWHMVLALSGQVANMTQGSLTFEPKLSPPFTFPVMLPGVWGYVEGEVFSPKHPIGGYVQYTVGLNFGSITLESLSISGCGLPINGSLSLRADELVRWDCDL